MKKFREGDRVKITRPRKGAVHLTGRTGVVVEVLVRQHHDYTIKITRVGEINVHEDELEFSEIMA